MQPVRQPRQHRGRGKVDDLAVTVLARQRG
jgi:hypothetical protein